MAMLYPEPEKGGRGKKAVKNTGFSNEYLSKARKVLEALPSVAQEVISGGLRVDEAYQQALALQVTGDTVSDGMG